MRKRFNTASRLLLFTKLIYLTFLYSREWGHYTCQVELSVQSWGYYSLNVSINTDIATMASLWRRDLNKHLVKAILVKDLNTAYLTLADSKLQCEKKKSPNVNFCFTIFSAPSSLSKQQNNSSWKCRYLSKFCCTFFLQVIKDLFKKL